MAEGLLEKSVEDVNDNTIIQAAKDPFEKRMEVFPARVNNLENGRIVKEMIYKDLKIKTGDSHNGGEIIKKSADTNEINGNLLKTADKHDFRSNNKMQGEDELERTPKLDQLASKKELKQEKRADDVVVAESEVKFKDQQQHKTESKDRKRKAEELDEKPEKIVSMGNSTSKFHLKDKENKNVKSTGSSTTGRKTYNRGSYLCKHNMFVLFFYLLLIVLIICYSETFCWLTVKLSCTFSPPKLCCISYHKLRERGVGTGGGGG